MESLNLEHPSLGALSIKNLNTVLKKMIGNDQQFIKSQDISPKLWKCRWYNEILTDEKRLEYGYKRGEAVWLNTDTVDDVITQSADDIRDIIQKNQTLSIKYAKVSDDSAQEIEFVRKVVSGEITGNQDGMPLYYLGTLTNPTCIKVSLVDGNCDLPTDSSSKWKNFFVDNSKAKVSNLIINAAKQICAEQLQKHIDEYHFGGEEPELTSQYLLKDMSNLGDGYIYQNTAGNADTGLDFVLYTRGITIGNSYKWFRVWNSGMLEHGGIIRKADIDGLQDTCDSNNVYTVKLNWSLDTLVAPTYTYSCGYDGLYDVDNIDCCNGNTQLITDAGNTIGKTCGYSLQITPMMQEKDATTSTQPYQSEPVACDRAGNMKYRCVNPVSMTNKSFKFIYESGVQRYSYYITGFMNGGQQKYRT